MKLRAFIVNSLEAIACFGFFLVIIVGAVSGAKNGVLGFILGGIVGFLVAVLTFGTLFLLIEMNNNIRKLANK